MRARRDRPRHCRGAEERDELALGPRAPYPTRMHNKQRSGSQSASGG